MAKAVTEHVAIWATNGESWLSFDPDSGLVEIGHSDSDTERFAAPDPVTMADLESYL